MGNPGVLESFDPPGAAQAPSNAAALQKRADTAYRLGLEAGRKEAVAASDEAIMALAAALEAFSGAQEEITRLSAECGAAIGALARTLCPHLAARGFPHAAQALVEKTLHGARPICEARASPQSAALLTEALAGLKAVDVAIEGDPALTPHQLTLSWRGGGAMLDFDGAAREILDLAARLEETQEA